MRDGREFISEAVSPDLTTLRNAATPTGEPARPMRFAWRGRTYEVVEVLRTWKGSDAAHRGPGMAYVPRHWAEVRTACGECMRLYRERGRPGPWVLHGRERPRRDLKP